MCRITLKAFLMIIFIFFNIARAEARETEKGKMTSQRAIELIKAFAKIQKKSFNEASLIPNKDFDLDVGAAGFRYSKENQTLIASGYVASGQVALVNKIAGDRIWERFIGFAKLQPATLGEGYLEIYTGPADPGTKKPAVYLSKSFKDPLINEEQFTKEVKWITRWAVYWRDERWNEIFSARKKDQLEKESKEAEVWALKKHPRPW